MDKAVENDPAPPKIAANRPFLSPGLGLGLVLLGSLLLFLHGCHGADEDHELFARPFTSMSRE